MPKTLLLDTDEWDLVLDANGDIALADEPYAISQDVASAIRTFQTNGSSPRMRGIRRGWHSVRGVLRFIPADAGNTQAAIVQTR